MHPLSQPFPAVNPTVPLQKLAVLPTLGAQAKAAKLDTLSAQLLELQGWLAGDLQLIESALLATDGVNLAQRAAHHILASGGKRLRPICVLLASRLGPKAADLQVRLNARDLAVAVELVHAATLLHDDVVDLSDTRRGHSAARLMVGNEISIFGGDWLLVEALKRICSTNLPDLVPCALQTIESMIFAEVEQAQRARCLASDRDGYLRVVDGKTAALFRWAFHAGARAGDSSPQIDSTLAVFATHLGIAFQLIDDALDLDGDVAKTGKPLFSDLAEGKITLPLAMLLERAPQYLGDLEQIHRAALRPNWREQNENLQLCEKILNAAKQTGAIEAAQQVAAEHLCLGQRALDHLDPHTPELHALRAIADAMATRQA